jgi:hypothetical protein
VLKLKSSISLLAILVLATPVLAQDDAKDQPLLPELLSAQKIFVQQTLIDPRIVSKFRSEIAKWDHYEVVTSADDADLVAMLSAEVQYTQTVTDSEATADDGGDETSRGSDAGIRPLGTVRTLDDVHLTISTPDGKEIWTDAVPVTGMSGGAAKRLVKRLRNRIEDEA